MRLAVPVEAGTLAAFRGLFGALMLAQVYRYFSKGQIGEFYAYARFTFPYPGLEFIQPLPGAWSYLLFAVIAASAAAILLGYRHRVAAAVFVLTHGYVCLIDQTHYNNHYYLIELLAFLLIFVDASRCLSLDAWRRREPGPTRIPTWNLLVLKAQWLIVYFHAGLAKFDGDWLSGEVLRGCLTRDGIEPPLRSALGHEGVIQAVSYGGLLFDLGIGPLLVYRKTRPAALLLATLFHLTNQLIFDIGVFPLLGIASLVLFLEPETPRRAIEHLARALGSNAAAPEKPIPDAAGERPARVPARLTSTFLGLYLSVQALLPLRHHLIDGDASWTDEGHLFAWRMKVREKIGLITFVVTDPRSGTSWKITPQKEGDLTERQALRMATRPTMILHYARHLHELARRRGLQDAIVRAETAVSLNNRPPAPLVSPSANLATVEYSLFRHNAWILPRPEP